VGFFYDIRYYFLKFYHKTFLLKTQKLSHCKLICFFAIPALHTCFNSPLVCASSLLFAESALKSRKTCTGVPLTVCGHLKEKDEANCLSKFQLCVVHCFACFVEVKRVGYCMLVYVDGS
jgi:hypothetical protein